VVPCHTQVKSWREVFYFKGVLCVTCHFLGRNRNGKHVERVKFDRNVAADRATDSRFQLAVEEVDEN
jgi:hypothetical protein